MPGAVLNIAECCLLPSDVLKKQDDRVAVVWRDEGFDDSPINSLTLKELRDQVMYVFFFYYKFNWNIGIGIV